MSQAASSNATVPADSLVASASVTAPAEVVQTVSAPVGGRTVSRPGRPTLMVIPGGMTPDNRPRAEEPGGSTARGRGSTVDPTERRATTEEG